VIMSHPCDQQTCDRTSFHQETHSVSCNIGYVMRQELERSPSIMIIVFDSLKACTSSGRWLPVQTRVYLFPLRECKGLFLTAVHSMHAALPGVSRTGPFYVQFTRMRCQILAALPHASICTLPATFYLPSPQREIEKFIIRQPPIGGKDDYDSDHTITIEKEPQTTLWS